MTEIAQAVVASQAVKIAVVIELHVDVKSDESQKHTASKSENRKVKIYFTIDNKSALKRGFILSNAYVLHFEFRNVKPNCDRIRCACSCLSTKSRFLQKNEGEFTEFLIWL